jgi:hypothetical protein
MAFVDGVDQKTSSVGRSLARAKLPQQGQAPMAGGKSMTVTETAPGGSVHTSTPEGEHMDHPSMEHATAHMHKHFGHKGHEKHEKEHAPQAEEEAPAMEGGEGGGLEAMGVAGA